MKVLSHLFLPGSLMTNLERMVATRAIGSSFLSNLSTEISVEHVAIEIMNARSNNAWIVSIFFIYLYGMYQYSEGAKSKLDKIEIYGKYSSLIRELLFVFFLVFTRDVQNAI